MRQEEQLFKSSYDFAGGQNAALINIPHLAATAHGSYICRGDVLYADKISMRCVKTAAVR